MPKTFKVVIPREQCDQCTKLFDVPLFPTAYKKEQLADGNVHLTVYASLPEIEQRLEHEIFGPGGMLSKQGFTATVSEDESVTCFTLHVPRCNVTRFLELWKSTSPGKRIGPWSCVSIEEKSAKPKKRVLQIRVQNEIAADVIEQLLKSAPFIKLARVHRQHIESLNAA